MKRGGPIPRRTRLRTKGGSRFPKRRDPKFMAWMAQQLLDWRRCDCGCGRRATTRAHLDAKGNGGYDRGNVVLLTWWPCHCKQEKRTDAFNAERGCDLYAAAKRWADQYEQEGNGWAPS